MRSTTPEQNRLATELFGLIRPRPGAISIVVQSTAVMNSLGVGSPRAKQDLRALADTARRIADLATTLAATEPGGLTADSANATRGQVPGLGAHGAGRRAMESELLGLIGSRNGVVPIVRQANSAMNSFGVGSASTAADLAALADFAGRIADLADALAADRVPAPEVSNGLHQAVAFTANPAVHQHVSIDPHAGTGDAGPSPEAGIGL